MEYVILSGPAVVSDAEFLWAIAGLIGLWTMVGLMVKYEERTDRLIDGLIKLLKRIFSRGQDHPGGDPR